MTPVATRPACTCRGPRPRMLRLALAVLGLGLPTAPFLLAFGAPADTAGARCGSALPCPPAVTAEPPALVAAHALTLQGRTRSLQEMFGRGQWFQR